jgi:hypothetical protein
MGGRACLPAATRCEYREEPVKRIVVWALLAFAVWWVVEDPASAAALVHGTGHALSHAARSLSAFASDASSQGK